MQFRLFSLLALLLFSSRSEAGLLLPSPLFQENFPGEFSLQSGDTILFPEQDEKAAFVAKYLQATVARNHSLSLQVVASPSKENQKSAIKISRCAIRFSKSEEAYRITVDKTGIHLCAAKNPGLFYAATTLWQLLEKQQGNSLPFTKIEDAPRFSWRGMMLDSARHYQSAKFIKKLLDTLSFFKMNVLHWHLTDDQAWRLEIKQYPRLTDIGAWRVPAGLGPSLDIDPATGKPRLYGGFYSQDEVKDLVQYASDRNITIVPEIEMPGHSSAAIVAYPNLGSTTDLPTAIPHDWGVFPYLYNVGDDSFQFLENVLDEVITLFPGKFIHVGGDEAIKDEWQNSLQAQQTIKKFGLKNEDELQSWFVQRIEKYLETKGKRIIGWDDILSPRLGQDSAVMSWHGLDGAVKGAKSGHDVVVTAAPNFYFDGRMNESADQPPGVADNVISLQDAYEFNPMPSNLSTDQQVHILGIEGAVWTEYFRTEDQLSLTAFPRELAIAELGWASPQNTNWQSFLSRMPAAQASLSALGMNYSDSPFEPILGASRKKGRDTIDISMSNQTNFGELRYSLDGSDPAASSALFSSALSIPIGTTLRAATFYQGQRISRIKTKHFDLASLQTKNSFELRSCSSEGYSLASEDDAPSTGARAFFIVNYMHPCWIYENANLSDVVNFTASVGQLPFNLQIGSDINEIHYNRPSTPSGELEVRIDNCSGEPILSIPLGTALSNPAVTTLPSAQIPAQFGTHDLCLSFTQWSLDPYWVIDTVSVTPATK